MSPYTTPSSKAIQTPAPPPFTRFTPFSSSNQTEDETCALQAEGKVVDQSIMTTGPRFAAEQVRSKSTKRLQRFVGDCTQSTKRNTRPRSPPPKSPMKPRIFSSPAQKTTTQSLVSIPLPLWFFPIKWHTDDCIAVVAP
ncbi:hypothetical protein IWX91DRAFT_325646 [Phyllosticta citricarpa]